MIFSSRFKKLGIRLILAAPIIYGVFFLFLFVDVVAIIFQSVVFSLLGIEKVDRNNYIGLDRGGIQHLSWLDSINCNYCGYANGVLSWLRALGLAMEQYWCPIKHHLNLVADVNRPEYVSRSDKTGLEKKINTL